MVPTARIHTGDAAAVLARLDDTFDLVTLWDVFEHLPDPVAVLRELARRLPPGGHIYVQTIHERSLVPAAGRLLYRLSGGRVRYPARRTHDAHHLVFFTRQGIERAATEAGLRVELLWFDRLTRRRMDGGSLLTAATASLLSVENALGNGLFVNVVLRPIRRPRDGGRGEQDVLSEYSGRDGVEDPADRKDVPIVSPHGDPAQVAIRVAPEAECERGQEPDRIGVAAAAGSESRRASNASGPTR